MNLQQQLMEDMKAAMKAGQRERLAAIRMLRAQLKDAEIAKGGQLSPEEELKVLGGAVKKRKESIAAFEAAGRQDLVAREKEQLAALEAYLPQQLSAQELEREIDAVIAEVGAVSIKDLGKVMAEAMKRLRGRAEGRLVQDLVRRRLE